MKKTRSVLAIILVMLLLFVSACGKSIETAPTPTPKAKSQAEATELKKTTPSIETADSTEEITAAEAETPAPDLDTQIFTDSIGRNVEIPATIDRIAPSGTLAQVVLFTLCPEKLVGLSGEWSEGQKPFIDPSLQALPVFGSFYADTFNLESVMTADPQIVIDIGEAKETVHEDMKLVQEKTGIPSVFVHMELDSMAEAYRTLGKLVDKEEQAEQLATYVEETLTMAREHSETLRDDERISVYYGQGDAGLTAVVKGTIHSDVLDIVGAMNVADVGESVRGGASDISMEQLMLWQPEVILFAPGSIYNDVADMPEWAQIQAIKEDNFYLIPNTIYNWMGRPPAVNRLIGIRWVGNLLYPDLYQLDMANEAKVFYELFYHVTLTEDQVTDMLENATARN